MKALVVIIGVTSTFLFASPALARVSVSPFVSIGSDKKIKPDETGKDKTETTQRVTYGVNATVSFWRLFGLQLSLGQNRTETETKTGDVVDEWDEIDYKSDLDMSTDDPERDVKITETQRRGRLGVVFDPGFWILVARAKAGVQATQRIIKLQEGNESPVEHIEPITYKPYAGAGLGVKLSPRMQAMAEYHWFFYRFPDWEPFEREVTVSLNIALGSSR